MARDVGMASQVNQKRLITLLDKIEKNRQELILEIEKYINKLPASVLKETNFRDLPSILGIIFKELKYFRKKLHLQRFDLAMKRLRRGTSQSINMSQTFGTFVLVWSVFREIVLTKSGKWFPEKTRKSAIAAGEQFWTLSLFEIVNAYLAYTDQIIREKTLESSVLFHTTQSITTELDLESLLSKIVFHAGMLMRNKQMFLLVTQTENGYPEPKKSLVLKSSNQVGRHYDEYSIAFGEGVLGKLALDREPLLDNQFHSGKESAPFLKQTAHLLVAPITFSDELLGVLIAAESRKTEPFNEAEKELLVMYSQQIAITFKNVLLYLEQAKVTRELEEKNKMLEEQADLVLRRTAQMVVLNEVSQKVNSSLDLKEVITLLAQHAAESIGLDRCVVWLFDDNKVKLVATAAYGLHSKIVEKMQFQLADIRDTGFFKTLSELTPYRIKSSEDKILFSEILRGHMTVNTMLVVPLVLKEEAIGILAVDDTRETHEFLDDEVTLISAIANHTVMAIANARLYQKVREQAITDGLTGVYNHRFFQIRFSDEFSNSKRYGNDLSLIIVDIDHFKRYNDTYGHVAGDLALKEIANLTKASVRENDIVARYGGEEFAIILPMTNERGAQVVAERIRTSVLECRFLGDLNVPQVSITVSLGYATFNDSLEAREILFRRADAALYYAKEHGRNRSVPYTEDMVDPLETEKAPVR